MFSAPKNFFVDSIEILANIAGMTFGPKIPALPNPDGIRC
jgi:hypothetical protein